MLWYKRTQRLRSHLYIHPQTWKDKENPHTMTPRRSDGKQMKVRKTTVSEHHHKYSWQKLGDRHWDRLPATPRQVLCTDQWPALFPYWRDESDLKAKGTGRISECYRSTIWFLTCWAWIIISLCLFIGPSDWVVSPKVFFPSILSPDGVLATDASRFLSWGYLLFSNIIDLTALT